MRHQLNYTITLQTVSWRKLEQGMEILITYGQTVRSGYSFPARIIGFTSDEEPHGKGGVKFQSAQELLSFYNVKSLKALEELQDENDYGFHTYMVVEDLETGETGPWLYLFKGRWSIGSGAHRVTLEQPVITFTRCPNA